MARKRAVVYFIFAAVVCKGSNVRNSNEWNGRKERCCFGYWQVLCLRKERGKKKDESGHGGSTLL